MLFNQIINLRGLDRGVRKQHLPSFLHYFGASRTVAAAAGQVVIAIREESKLKNVGAPAGLGIGIGPPQG